VQTFRPLTTVFLWASLMLTLSLYFWQIVMDEHQRSNGIPVTRFTLQSIYAQSDDEKLEFEYESGNTIILVRWSLMSHNNNHRVYWPYGKVITILE
jgi:hypothetical protein